MRPYILLCFPIPVLLSMYPCIITRLTESLRVARIGINVYAFGILFKRFILVGMFVRYTAMNCSMNSYEVALMNGIILCHHKSIWIYI